MRLNLLKMLRFLFVSILWEDKKDVGVEASRFFHYHTNWFHSIWSVSLLMESFVCRILTSYKLQIQLNDTNTDIL